MKKIALLLLLSQLAFAYSPESFTFRVVFFYEDGSPLLNDRIDEFRVYCNGAVVATLPNFATNEAIRSVTSDDVFYPGTYTCHATTVADGVESVPSNTKVFTVDAKQPAAPIEFRIE